MSSLFRLQRQQNDSLKSILNSNFTLSSYSFRIESTNTFLHSLSYVENHTRFQTKMGKVFTRFQTKTARKHFPLK